MIEVKTRLYPGQDDDLIAWLEGISGDYGARSTAIREALRRGIGLDGSSKGGTAVDLAEIRLVVEAAVSSALAGVAVVGAGQAEDDDEGLQDLLDNLIMKGDDE